jgi:diguanylate cyclase (GGDEF)-like protein/PAS domain S-box-containing protein
MSEMAPEPVRVLGVEDSAAEADLIRVMLAHANGAEFRVEHVQQLAHARERLSESHPHVVLLDLNLQDSDGLWDWDVVQERAYFSPRWKAMLGYGVREIGERIEEWFERVEPEDLEGLRAALFAHLERGTEHFEYEHRVLTKGGERRWVLCRGLAVRDESGRAYRMAGSLTDVSLRKRAEARLLYDALHDALTGLANRALYLDRLEVALRQYQRDRRKLFAVLFFDLDRFKNVNDSLGHTVGDELLVAVARRLEGQLRPGDTLARLGGDEFAILLNGIEGVQDAEQVAERLHELMAHEFSIGEHEVYTTVSIGIAMSAGHYWGPEEMLRDADLAMYRAKRAGNSCCEVFDSDMHERALAQLRLETDLRRAVERREFVMHYQPIVSLVTERILGFEALLRWQHPERGLLYPDQFIAAAEETGLIVPIAWQALAEACGQTRQWQQLFPTEPPLSISINISGKLFLYPRMSERLLEILAERGLAASSLRVEITESAIMDHREAALEELKRLRAAGVQLHIDDFGTGYSSLTYLQRFSYDSLKIDRSFVSNLREPGEAGAIVEAIVALGRMLNMNVIAEGVETPEQLQSLRAMNCPEAQGYWFSRPLDHAAIDALLLGASRRVD